MSPPTPICIVILLLLLNKAHYGGASPPSQSSDLITTDYYDTTANNDLSEDRFIGGSLTNFIDNVYDTRNATSKKSLRARQTGPYYYYDFDYVEEHYRRYKTSDEFAASLKAGGPGMERIEDGKLRRQLKTVKEAMLGKNGTEFIEILVGMLIEEGILKKKKKVIPATTPAPPTTTTTSATTTTTPEPYTTTTTSGTATMEKPHDDCTCLADTTDYKFDVISDQARSGSRDRDRDEGTLISISVSKRPRQGDLGLSRVSTIKVSSRPLNLDLDFDLDLVSHFLRRLSSL